MPDKPAGGTLILLRHGESHFNHKGLWTGVWDIPLTGRGRQQAQQVASSLTDFKPNVAFTSGLIRAQETLKIILKANHWKIPIHQSKSLNERDYGELTGWNKWEVEKRYGPDEFLRLRRSWDEPVPGGETLKQTSARAVPYFEANILPLAAHGQTAIVAAHGNSLRTLIKQLEHISDQDVERVEVRFGEILIYKIGLQGEVAGRTIRQIVTPATNA